MRLKCSECERTWIIKMKEEKKNEINIYILENILKFSESVIPVVEFTRLLET